MDHRGIGKGVGLGVRELSHLNARKVIVGTKSCRGTNTRRSRRIDGVTTRDSEAIGRGDAVGMVSRLTIGSRRNRREKVGIGGRLEDLEKDPLLEQSDGLSQVASSLYEAVGKVVLAVDSTP